MADKPELMTVPCRHEVPDSSGRRYTICKKSWYFLALVFDQPLNTAGYDDEIDEVRQWADLKKSYNSLRVAIADFE